MNIIGETQAIHWDKPCDILLYWGLQAHERGLRLELLPLTSRDVAGWAELLAVAFDRSAAEMAALLTWLTAQREIIAWGAWDGERLAAQYACLLSTLHIPGMDQPVQVGLSLNMAVHPDYRGRGLIKQVSKPVYEHLAEQGCVAGVGFSNAQGIKVDRNSKSYGYRVCGQMQSLVAWLPRRQPPLELTETWPLDDNFELPTSDEYTHFVYTAAMLRHRYAEHPFRRYHFGVWREGDQVCGLVVYRHVRVAGLPAAALLAAYGDDLPALIARWGAAVAPRIAHAVVSSASPIGAALRQIGCGVALPYTRSPYYLTIKPLRDDLPAAFFSFDQWDCIGGDIL